MSKVGDKMEVREETYRTSLLVIQNLTPKSNKTFFTELLDLSIIFYDKHNKTSCATRYVAITTKLRESILFGDSSSLKKEPTNIIPDLKLINSPEEQATITKPSQDNLKSICEECVESIDENESATFDIVISHSSAVRKLIIKYGNKKQELDDFIMSGQRKSNPQEFLSYSLNIRFKTIIQSF